MQERAGGVFGRLPKPIRDTARAAKNTNLLLYAGGLAFYALISVAPTIVIAFWIAGWFVGEDSLEELGENLSELGGGNIELGPTFSQMAGVGTGIGFVAIMAALWPATAYGSGLVRAFDDISEGDRSAKGLRGRAKAMLLIALVPFFVLGALGTSYVVTGLVGDGAAGTVAGWALALVAGWLASGAVLVLLYRVFGPLPLAWKSLVLGAAVTAAAISVMSLGYTVYMGQGADFEERVAGSGLAAVVLLGLWLYLANLLLLTGYFVARECDEHVVGGSQHDDEVTSGDRRKDHDNRGDRAGDAA